MVDSRRKFGDGVYLPRIADDEVIARLGYSGAVLIEGARACGKTATALQHAKSEILLDGSRDVREVAELEPSHALAGARPRLIDEWQLVPSLWNAARRIIDDDQGLGLFIFTGSAAPTDDVTRHSGAGRFSRLRMRPMSVFEAGLGVANVSLADLFAGGPVSGNDSGRQFSDIIECVCRGGFPAHRNLSLDQAMQRMLDYVHEIELTDVRRPDGVRRDPVRVAAVISALSRNVATEVTIKTLNQDAAGFAGLDSMSVETTVGCLTALTRIMIVENQQAWRPHLRSRARIRVAPKRHFVDPAIAVAALGARPDDLRDDIRFMGLLFESMVIRDLRILSSPLGGEVSHYRDSVGLEVDAIVTSGYQRWAAFEVKLAATGPMIEKAAANLLKLAADVDSQVAGRPKALVIITGSGYAYTRPDGVSVVPIWNLAP